MQGKVDGVEYLQDGTHPRRKMSGGMKLLKLKVKLEMKLLLDEARFQLNVE